MKERLKFKIVDALHRRCLIKILRIGVRKDGDRGMDVETTVSKGSSILLEILITYNTDSKWKQILQGIGGFNLLLNFIVITSPQRFVGDNKEVELLGRSSRKIEIQMWFVCCLLKLFMNGTHFQKLSRFLVRGNITTEFLLISFNILIRVDNKSIYRERLWYIMHIISLDNEYFLPHYLLTFSRRLIVLELLFTAIAVSFDLRCIALRHVDPAASTIDNFLIGIS